MSEFRSVRGEIRSSLQTIAFYNKNFQGVHSVDIGIKAVNVPMIEGFRAALCNLQVERYEYLLSRQVDLNGIRFVDFVNIEVTPTVYVQNLNGVRSAVQIINIGERKYVIVGSQSYPLFNPSTLVVTLYECKLSLTIFMNIYQEPPYIYSLQRSYYHGIFNGAINAKKVILKANFSIYVPSARKIIVAKSYYSQVMHPFVSWRKMRDNYERYITFMSVFYGRMERNIGIMSTEEAQNPTPFPQEPRDFGAVRSGRFSIEQKRIWGAIRSIPIPFHLELQSFLGVRHNMSMKMFNHNFNAVRSHTFNVLRVRADSVSSVFKDLDTGRYHLFAVTAKTYISEELTQIPSSKYFFAKHIGLKTIPRNLSYLCRLVIPFVETKDFSAVRSAESPLSVVIEIVGRQDFGAFRSNWMNLIAGEKELINKDGLYRDVFIDSTKELTHFKTPWTPKQSDMRFLGREPFFGISFVEGLDVFKIRKESKQTILLNWEMTTLSHEHWLIPPFGIAPYLKAETADRSNFIILSLSPTGGSIVHMHKDGFKEHFSLDGGYNQQEFIVQDHNGEDIVLTTIKSSEAETAALVVGSNRYKRNAKILYEVERGVLWDSLYVDEAVRYMTEFREETFFFYDAPYSPAVLRSIILDKSKGLLHKNIFDKPDIMCFDSSDPMVEEDVSITTACEGNTIYIHEIVEEIEETGVIYSFVKNHVDIRLRKSAAQVAMVFTNKKIKMSETGPVIDNCATGSLCSKMLVSKQSLSGNVISRPLHPRYSASWVNDRGIYDHAVILPPPNLATGDNITFSAFRSIKFINLKADRVFNRVTSNIILCSISFGTFRNGIRYEDRLTTGLKAFNAVRSAVMSMSVKTFSTNLNSLRSDFKIKVSWNVPSGRRNEIRSIEIPLTISKGIRSWEGVSNNRSSTIWLKMFPQHYAGRSAISSPIMDFYITDREFDRSISFPFGYADTSATPAGRPAKSSSPDFIEKKAVEIPDILESEPVPPEVLDSICGDSRYTTLLEYENFDHIFREGDDQIFGRLTWEDRKFIMSAYLRIRENTVIKKGVKLSEADILRRTLVEVRLSAIEDLGVVEEWHIEDFTLELEDFNLEASQAEQLTSIDDVFRAALKSVIETIGSDASAEERHKGEDQFPAFPDRRVIGDEMSQTVKPRQYFIVEEEE
jgi:hypothetical protein